MKSWLSAHLYFRGSIYGAECDRLLTQSVFPLIARLQTFDPRMRAFFVRYVDVAPHVRLRVCAPGQDWRESVSTLLLDHFRHEHPGVAVGATVGPVRLAGVGVVSEVRWIPYEPEWARYGGAEGIEVAEELFVGSTICVSEMLSRSVPEARADRRGQALLATLVMLHIFSSDSEVAAEFAEGYAANYLQSLFDNADNASLALSFRRAFELQGATIVGFIQEAWSRLANAESLTPALDRYVDVAHIAVKRARRISERMSGGDCRDLVCSYIHMTNNRLGVSILDECYLASLIARALRSSPSSIGPARDPLRNPSVE